MQFVSGARKSLTRTTQLLSRDSRVSHSKTRTKRNAVEITGQGRTGTSTPGRTCRSGRIGHSANRTEYDPLYDSKGQLIPPSAKGQPTAMAGTLAAAEDRDAATTRGAEQEGTRTGVYQEVPKQLVYRAELVRQPATTSGDNQQQAAPASGQPISYAPQQQQSQSRSKGHRGRPAAHVAATATGSSCGH